LRRTLGVIVVILWLRNAWEGIAFLRYALLGWEGGEYRWHAQASTGTVPRGEEIRLTFSFGAADEDALDFPALLRQGDFSIKVEYSDLAGNVWTTRADLRLDRVSDAWSVAGIVLEAHGKTPVVGWQG
jgi:hypothetical protein